MAARELLSIEDLKALLHQQRNAVAYHYAPAAPDSYEDKGGYWTTNPGRADRHTGSFVIWLDGRSAGRWNDYANGTHGDLLDLIKLSMGCGIVDALREARNFLGLESRAPADLARARDAAERAKRLRAEAARKARADAEKMRRLAQGLWLQGQEKIAGTPAELYLRDTRGIDLAALGRQPRALRYHPRVRYRHFDKATGEEIRGEYPAILTAISNGAGTFIACHRTYLAQGLDGWIKAPVPEPKKVLGDYRGGAIRIWSGVGPKGGKGVQLSRTPFGTRVYLSEGIEDALSAAVINPAARVLAGVSLSNLGNVELPDAVTEVVLIADQDDDLETRATLDRAAQAHAARGRLVRVWLNQRGGKDLNDAIRGPRS